MKSRVGTGLIGLAAIAGLTAVTVMVVKHAKNKAPATAEQWLRHCKKAVATLDELTKDLRISA